MAAGDGARFDLKTVPARQAAVWVRKFLDADISIFAFASGRLASEFDPDRNNPVTPISRTVSKEISVGEGLLAKLGGSSVAADFIDRLNEAA